MQSIGELQATGDITVHTVLLQRSEKQLRADTRVISPKKGTDLFSSIARVAVSVASNKAI